MKSFIAKSYFNSISDFLCHNKSKLSESVIFIFGAGTRGTDLLSILKNHDFNNIIFVDNDPNKQGTKVCDCNVISFEESRNIIGKKIYLSPSENNNAILKQLNDAGLQDNVDFFDLKIKFDDYKEVIERIKDQKESSIVLIGDCASADYVVGDGIVSDPLLEVMEKNLFCNDCKAYTFDGIDPILAYYILKADHKLSKVSPKKCTIIAGVYSLSPNYCRMLGKTNWTQIKSFIEELLQIFPGDEEILSYHEKICKFLNQSVKMKAAPKNYDNNDKKARLYKLKYNYSIREFDESIVYLKKIIKYMNDNDIEATLLFPPVNFEVGEQLCGAEFKVKYTAILDNVHSFLKEYKYNTIDASFIASSEYFVFTPQDVEPVLSGEGQRLLLDYLREQDEFR